MGGIYGTKKKDNAPKQEAEDIKQAEREGTEEVTGKVRWN